MTPQQICAAYGINLLSDEVAGQTIAIIDAYDDPDLVSSSSAPTTQATCTTSTPIMACPILARPVGPRLPSWTKMAGPTIRAPTRLASGKTRRRWTWNGPTSSPPMANIVLLESPDSSFGNLINTAVQTAGNLPGVSVVSMSFNAGEFVFDPGRNSYFTTPSGHTGVTFVASTGDAGAPSGYPAFSPNVLAVGGTSLTLSGNSYGSETGWSGSGGGVSQYESQPSYQQGLVIHNGGSTVNANGMRSIPDVAFDADPNTGVAIYDSYNGGSSPWFQYGGTSLAAPCWAGLIAIADEMRVSAGLTTLDGPSQTLPSLYSLPAADFHDITSGTSTGSPNYTAAAGYDLVTGLGTPVANLLVPDLALGSPQPDLTLTAAHAGNFQQEDVGDTYTIAVSNSGSGETSGTVSLVDTLPGGLTATAMSGSGWTVDLATLTATRSESLAPGASYPALTITVNVAATAPASVTNTATVSGGGEVVPSMTRPVIPPRSMPRSRLAPPPCRGARSRWPTIRQLRPAAARATSR